MWQPLSSRSVQAAWFLGIFLAVFSLPGWSAFTHPFTSACFDYPTVNEACAAIGGEYIGAQAKCVWENGDNTSMTSCGCSYDSWDDGGTNYGQGAGANEVLVCHIEDPGGGCTEGDLGPSCRVECPANGHHTGGYVGFGQTCPYEYTESDYGCITDGDYHTCEPDGVSSKLPDHSGQQPVDGSGLQDGNGNDIGSSLGNNPGGVTHGQSGYGGQLLPGGGDCLTEVLANGTLPPWCSESDLPGYENWIGLDNDCTGNEPWICDESDFENTNVFDACLLNPGMAVCNDLFETQEIYDLCWHGGLPDPVNGCLYDPPVDADCATAGMVFNSSGVCVDPPSIEIQTPKPPENQNNNPDNNYNNPNNTTTSTSTQTSTSTSETTTIVEGNTTYTTTNNTTYITNETTTQGAGQCDPTSADYAQCIGMQEESGAGECDPESSDYFECIGGNEPIDPSSYSTRTQQSLTASTEAYTTGLSSIPVIAAAQNITTAFDGQGACPAPTFDAFGSTWALDYHCTLYQSISGILSAAMLVFWTLAGIRHVMSA